MAMIDGSMPARFLFLHGTLKIATVPNGRTVANVASFHCRIALALGQDGVRRSTEEETVKGEKHGIEQSGTDWIQ